MIAEDEDSLICDLCETYGIIDYRKYTLELIATLALGLPDDSRIKTKLAGLPAAKSTITQAAILDRLNTLIWLRTKDAVKGRNRPASIVQQLYDAARPKNVQGYDSGEEFMRAREALLNR